MFYIYAHINPLTKEVFYIGSGNRKRPTIFGNRDKHWQDYVQLNGKPIVRILRIVETKGIALEVEKYYISKYKRKVDGGTLINKSIGGLGPTGVIVGIETREKLGKIRKGRKLSDEFKKKLSESAKNSIKVKFKIEKLTENKKKIVLDKSSGIFYDGVKEAANAYGIKQGTLTSKLNGRLKNNTNFCYA
jgi:hypothetical protein